jgi:Protein of unknown function (DUF3499)
MNRGCARRGCVEHAAATFTYDYRARTTWLDGLASEAHPMSYDLCKVHADALSVPRGWRLEDRLEDRRDPTPYGASLAY